MAVDALPGLAEPSDSAQTPTHPITTLLSPSANPKASPMGGFLLLVSVCEMGGATGRHAVRSALSLRPEASRHSAGIPVWALHNEVP